MPASNQKLFERMIYLFPGMGADRRMYPGPWSSLKPRTCIEWPCYAGETSIGDLAKRIIADYKITAGDLLVGSSLGVIVACEIVKTTPVAGLVLVGSAKSNEEINRFVSFMHPLIELTPLQLAQRLSACVPGELAQMFSDSQAGFIRAMCREGVQNVLNGGHLIAMTHAQECVDIITAYHRSRPVL